MRYRFVDDVMSLDLGAHPRIEVAKTFAAGDDAFSGPLGDDRVPNSLLLELLAMTGGHLAFRHGGARRLPLLLKVPECRFEGTARAGDRLRATATLTGTSEVSADAGMAEAQGEVFAGDVRVATGRLLYLCVAVAGADLAAFAAEPPR
jgi:3-hydroxymyristoyl/3-hydroxydecanoyl-(acyl carrier protein) dehydratase